MVSLSSLHWKLYENPHFSSESLHEFPRRLLSIESIETPPHPINNLAEIDDLRSDLELERRLRRDSESLTRSLSLELAEERRLRAEAEADAARCREAAGRAALEAEEERRMLKYADAWREERVQMKLTEAAIVLEEKMREIAKHGVPRSSAIDCKGSQGRENLHIKKGVKGFADSPRMAGKVRSPGSVKQKEQIDKNLECQKSQLRVLLRQRNTVNLGMVADSQRLVVR
ncbi:hypothetical protein KFK09_015789 [Dendrobium nobile]|uniref:Uncharacterized protein n=1 Tax=Dendrobium nobile TaxID=94219 RepID=A0A8T3BBI0_DENNO|nr:hypothetical protein KFK09_015789 [Dendrobium nobile]